MSRDNYGKLWLQRLLNDHAIKRAQAEIQSTGRALPCVVQSVAGQIVTVTFDLDSTPWTLPPVTIPVATSIYDWIPVQPGDKGITLPGDVYLGALSGLGGGTATMKEPGNLSSLVFVPVANVSWSAPGGDPNMRVSQGPDGVLIQDLTGAVSGLFSKSNGITLKFGSTNIILSSSGISLSAGGKTFTFNAAGFTDSNGNVEETHVHLYTPGSGTPIDTGGPTG